MTVIMEQLPVLKPSQIRTERSVYHFLVYT